MKRGITVIFVLIFSVMTIACESNTCSHKWEDATCTEPKRCSLCYKIEGTELGHTTKQGTCSRCSEYVGKKTWTMDEFVDEFDQPTGDKFISTRVEGKFSNSATTNSELIATMQITSNSVSIILREYGYYIVKNSSASEYDTERYDIVMMDTKGNKSGYMRGRMYGEGDYRIYFDSTSDETRILNALKEPGEVSFYIEYKNYTTSTYSFTVETSNFKDLYNQL